ncbi:MAG: hypothetical protein ACRC4M_04005 [Mycoplasma sp.]
MKTKKNVLITKLSILSLFLIFSIIWISISSVASIRSNLFLIIGFVVFILLLIVLIMSLMIKCNVYIIDNKEVIVYAGIVNHYLKVDNKVVSNQRTWIVFKGIRLDNNQEGKNKIEVDITPMNIIYFENDSKYIKPLSGFAFIKE